jgi:NAD(P)H-flavin reductase
MTTTRNHTPAPLLPAAHASSRWLDDDPLEPAGDPFLPKPYRVSKRTRETLNVVTLCLSPVDQPNAIGFAPGQFTMLDVPGIGEIPISISGDETNSRELVQTIRAVGPVSRHLCETPTGSWIGVRGPYGRPWPVRNAAGSDILIVAGGLGLAPLRPVLYHIVHDRPAFGHVTLLYGTRRPTELLFRRELERWRGRLDLEVEVTVDLADSSWRGHVGVVTRLFPRASVDRYHTVAFVCGPELMMRFAVRDLRALGLADERIFVSLERNMKCGIGVCGHCQLGPTFICRDGPVYSIAELGPWFGREEV